VGIRENNWYRVSFENSGDGFQTAVDPTDRNTVYSEAQDGRTVRSDLRTGITKSIRPVAPPAPGGIPWGGPGGIPGGMPGGMPGIAATGAAREAPLEPIW
jgi:hypothetical protein